MNIEFTEDDLPPPWSDKLTLTFELGIAQHPFDGKTRCQQCGDYARTRPMAIEDEHGNKGTAPMCRDCQSELVHQGLDAEGMSTDDILDEYERANAEGRPPDLGGALGSDDDQPDLSDLDPGAETPEGVPPEEVEVDD